MRKPETDLRIAIQLALRKKFPGSRSFKIHGNPYQEVGVPDLLCCIEGVFIGMEVKRPGKPTTEIQASVGRSILRAKGYFSRIESVEEALEFVEKSLSHFKSKT